jgi:hypothetical protein
MPLTKYLNMTFRRVRAQGTEAMRPLRVYAGPKDPETPIHFAFLEATGVVVRNADIFLNNKAGSENFDPGTWHPYEPCVLCDKEVCECSTEISEAALALTEKERIFADAEATKQPEALLATLPPPAPDATTLPVDETAPLTPHAAPVDEFHPMKFYRLGYKKDDVAAMSPEEKARIIQGNIRKEK